MDHTEDAYHAPDKPLIHSDFLQQLVVCLPMGAMVVNTEARILFVNDSLVDILGYSSDELLNADIDMLLPISFRENHKNLMQQFFKNPRKRQMGVGQSLFARKKDGGHIPIEIGLNPIEQDGQTFVLATLIDLTTRQRASDMFQRSIQSAPHGVLVVSSEGTIRLTNEALCQCFGYQSEALIDQPLDMLLPERYRKHHDQLRDSFHQNPTPRMMGVGRDLTALHKDGREFPVEIGLSPLPMKKAMKWCWCLCWISLYANAWSKSYVKPIPI
ncbi:PAS domain S-box protein, partial [Marinomonas pontica]|uniref:PAS domain-containing protein n=1 Tax=Marinomonas pontica TaxID=264739 RepID=UPI0022431788